MTVAELTAYLAKHCQPDWEVVIVDPNGTFAIAYAERSGSEKIGMLIPQAGPWKPTP
jgi:hypothetical protein